MNASQQFLAKYRTERLPQLVPGIFNGIPDAPDFTVDQRFVPLKKPVGV